MLLVSSPFTSAAPINAADRLTNRSASVPRDKDREKKRVGESRQSGPREEKTDSRTRLAGCSGKRRKGDDGGERVSERKKKKKIEVTVDEES